MPQVPTYDSAQVLPNAAPAPFRQPTAVDNQAGRQMSALGGAVQDVGEQRTQEEVYAQGMANQVRVDIGLNALRRKEQDLTQNPTSGFLSKRGQNALDPDPLGRSLQQQYGEQLDATISDIAANLGNPAQRRVFGEQAAALATTFGGNVQGHMMREYRRVGEEEQEGTVKLAADAAKRNFDKPKQVDAQVLSAKSAVWMLGHLRGDPGNLIESKMMDTTSMIHSGVIAAALENNNPAYAMSYIEAKKSEMTADDLLKANSTIKSDVRARTATATAQTAMEAVQRGAAPPETTRILHAAGVVDSTGGGEVKAPVPVTGDATARLNAMTPEEKKKFYAQADAQFALRPPDKASVSGLATKYAGDSSKVLAATVIDEATVDAAIKSAGKGGDWAGALSSANQAKLATAAATYNTQAAPKIPSQQDVHDAIRAQLGATPDPRVLAAALAEGTRMYADFTSNRKVQGENAMQAAQQWLVKNNGNMPALPPALANAVTQSAPGQYDNLIDFAKKVAKGENVTNMPAYLDAVANTEQLAKMPQSVFNQFVTTNFSQADGKQIAALRQAEIDGKEDTSTGSLNRPALNTALHNRLEAIGINPAPKELSEKARVGSIQKFVTDGIFAQQKQMGRKMTAQEVGDFVDATMAKNVTFRTAFLGVSTGTAQQNMLGLKIGDIPAESLTAIRSALSARGNTKPTDDQIMRTYWTSKNVK